jgi:hypothetical protein
MEFNIALKLFNVNIDLLFLSISMESSDFSGMFNYRKYPVSSCLGFSNIRTELVSLPTRQCSKIHSKDANEHINRFVSILFKD